MAKVSEFMTTELLTLTPDMPIDKAVSVLIDRGVHGAPVVENGTLVGILTDGDLVIGESRIHVPSMLLIFGEFAMWPPSVRKFERESEKSIATTVGEAMTRGVHTVGPEDGIEDVATIMHERHFTMMPVVDEGQLVGVISREDLLRALSQGE
jgi:CBS domain-containing protein